MSVQISAIAILTLLVSCSCPGPVPMSPDAPAIDASLDAPTCMPLRRCSDIGCPKVADLDDPTCAPGVSCTCRVQGEPVRCYCVTTDCEPCP